MKDKKIEQIHVVYLNSTSDNKIIIYKGKTYDKNVFFATIGAMIKNGLITDTMKSDRSKLGKTDVTYFFRSNNPTNPELLTVKSNPLLLLDEDKIALDKLCNRKVKVQKFEHLKIQLNRAFLTVAAVVILGGAAKVYDEQSLAAGFNNYVVNHNAIMEFDANHNAAGTGDVNQFGQMVLPTVEKQAAFEAVYSAYLNKFEDHKLLDAQVEVIEDKMVVGEKITDHEKRIILKNFDQEKRAYESAKLDYKKRGVDIDQYSRDMMLDNYGSENVIDINSQEQGKNNIR